MNDNETLLRSFFCRREDIEAGVDRLGVQSSQFAQKGVYTVLYKGPRRCCLRICVANCVRLIAERISTCIEIRQVKEQNLESVLARRRKVSLLVWHVIILDVML